MFPLKRTPPQTPEASITAETTVKTPLPTETPLYSIFSQQKLDSDIQEDSAAKRLKRKLDSTERIDKCTIITEMRTLFSQFTEEQDKKLSSLQTSIEKSVQVSIAALSTELSELTKSFEHLSARQEETVANLKIIEKDRQQDQEYIRSLERAVEFLERKARSSCLEIRNMPKAEGATGLTESKAELRNLIINLGTTVNTKIDEVEIKDIYRQHSNRDIIKPITVEFTTVLKKEIVLSSVKRFNKDRKGSDKLSTGHLRMKGPTQPVYVSECLTFRTKQLFRLAREFKNSHSYHHCWTANGAVYLRKKDGAPHIRINCEADLSKLELENSK